MWCANSANHIIGFTFYEGTLDAEILDSLYLVNLPPEEQRFSYFMQDGMSPHTAKETIQALPGVSGELHVGERLISKGLWPPRSQNLNVVNCNKIPENKEVHKAEPLIPGPCYQEAEIAIAKPKSITLQAVIKFL
jgi:hypothetical protein